MSGEEIVITFSEPWYKDYTDISPLTKEMFIKASEQIYTPEEPVITNTAAVDEAFMEMLYNQHGND